MCTTVYSGCDTRLCEGITHMSRFKTDCTSETNIFSPTRMDQYDSDSRRFMNRSSLGLKIRLHAVLNGVSLARRYNEAIYCLFECLITANLAAFELEIDGGNFLEITKIPAPLSISRRNRHGERLRRRDPRYGHIRFYILIFQL